MELGNFSRSRSLYGGELGIFPSPRNMKKYGGIMKKYEGKMISSYFSHTSHISGIFLYFPHISSYPRTYTRGRARNFAKSRRRRRGEGDDSKIPDLLLGKNFRGEATVKT